MADVGDLWRKTQIRFVFVVCFCLHVTSSEKLTYLYNSVNKYTTKYIVQNTSMTWWDAAHSGCSQYGGELVTLKSPYLPVDVTSLLPYGIYWIGGLEFSIWKWTDGSTLYTYEGYRSVSPLGYKIPGNSPFACHHQCGQYYHLFGLQGDRCHCLSSRLPLFNKGKNSEVRCPGNLYHRCGDKNGMSVYSIGNLRHMPSSLYSCGYVRVTDYPYWSGHYDLNTFLSTDCGLRHRKCAACNNTGQTASRFCSGNDDICVINNKAMWNTWNRSCSLIKLTPDIYPDLVNSVKSYSKGLNQHYCDGYWIGLSRYTDRRWIDGRRVNISHENIGLNTSPRCLAITHYYGPARTFWTSCSSWHKSVCEILSLTTATATTEQAPPSSTTSKGTKRTVVASNVKSVSENKENSGNTKIGTYVGSCVGVVTLILLALALVLSYRRKRFCFKSKADQNCQGNPDVQFSVTSDSPYPTDISPSSGSYPVPVAKVRPIYQNISLKDEIHRTDDPFSLPVKPESPIVKNTNDKDMYGPSDCHYEVPAIAESEMSASRERGVSTPGMTSSHDGDLRPYSLADQASFSYETSLNYHPTRIQRVGQEISGRNFSNIQLQNHPATHDHIAASAGSGHYDTVGSVGPAQRTCLNGTCSRIAGGQADDTQTSSGDKVELDEATGHIYHCIDDSNVGVYRKGNGYIKRGMDRSYYNVAFVPDTRPEIKEELDDNIYSLARTTDDSSKSN